MNREDAGRKLARKSNVTSESVTKKEWVGAKQYTAKSMTSTDQSEGGKDACKSNDITATPMRMTVTPNKKQQSKQEQVAPQKL